MLSGENVISISTNISQNVNQMDIRIDFLIIHAISIVFTGNKDKLRNKMKLIERRIVF